MADMNSFTVDNASVANAFGATPSQASLDATTAVLDNANVDRCRGIGYAGIVPIWPSSPKFRGYAALKGEDEDALLAAWRENYAWMEDACSIAMPVDASAPLGLTMTLTALKGYGRNNGVDLTAPEFNVFGSDTFSVTGDVPISFADNAELQAKGTITLDGVDFLASTTWIWTTGLRWNVDINAGQVLIISKAP